MESILRTVVVYVFILLLTRISGKRTLGELTRFDFILMLLVSEAAQQALIGEDFSVTNAMIVISTLVMVDVGMARLQRVLTPLRNVFEGAPMILVDQGKPLEDRLEKEELAVDDVLSEARTQRGLENLSQIKYAVLEKNGKISIIPWSQPERRPAEAGSGSA